MLIIGCDFHTRYQQIAMMDDSTGELTERRVDHQNGEANTFYRSLPGAGGWPTLGMASRLDFSGGRWRALGRVSRLELQGAALFAPSAKGACLLRVFVRAGGPGFDG
jgi:hypothetical protein